MSDKKTAEIKFRIEPSRKAAWQHAAADRDTSLSELIASAVDAQLTRDAIEAHWREVNQKLDGTRLPEHVNHIPTIFRQPPSAPWTFIHTNLESCDSPVPPDAPVGTFREVTDLPKEPAPWSFEAQNA